MNIEQRARRSIEIAQQCGQLLVGQGPDIQATALAQLVGIYLAGFPETLWPELLKAHATVAFDYARLHALELFGSAGHPGKLS